MAGSSSGDLMEEFKGVRIASLDDDDNEIQEEEEEEVLSTDDEVEEEEEIDYVHLGFVEKPENSRSLLRHSMPSKAGGFPAWLDPENLPSGRSFLCDICGEPLWFLMQVYAPDDGMKDAFHRTIFVFICKSLACLRCDQHEQWKRPSNKPSRSVKVFRCQLPQYNPFYPPQKDDKPATGGAELCTWCGTWKGIRRCSSCRKALYCSEKHQVKHSQLGHDYDCLKARIALEPNDNRVELPKAACTTVWPEFKIIEEYEKDYDAEDDDDDNSNSLVLNKNTRSDDATMSIMKEFESDDDEKKSWASFEQRISWAPEQVLRYSRDPGAKPLWPMASGRPSKDDIPPCRYCSGPMCFEFQILPQLLYYFQVSNEVDSLDWSTIAVYTCEASCTTNVAYKEEYAFVQLA